MDTIKWNDFEQVELRVGTITGVHNFPDARRPAYQLMIDFGPELGSKKSSAQITDLYTAEDLQGKQVLAVINFPPKQIGSFMSECLVTGFYQNDGAVVLVVPDRPVENGSKLL